MTERTLSQRERNRALLARQLLLEPADLSIPRAVERIGGLQAQYAPSAYIGLWTRLKGFRRSALTAALERRSVVQGTLMRSTIHLVSARDYPALAAGVRAARRGWWLRAARRTADEDTMVRTAERLRDLLAGGPLPRRELVRILDVEPAIWNGLGLWVDLVRVPPSGTWERRSADLYGLADAWMDVPEVTEAEGIDSSSDGTWGDPARPRRKRSRDGRACRARTSKECSRGCGCAGSGANAARCSTISTAHRSPLPTPRPRSGSCRPGTPPCSSTNERRRSSPNITVRESSTRRPRTRFPPSSWTDRSPERGTSKEDASGSSPSSGCCGAVRIMLDDEAERLRTFHEDGE